MASSPHILFVDDEHLLHGLIRRLFARQEIEVSTAPSALQAIDLLRAQPFDLVVTDFMMPDMDGLELLAHIRKHYPQTQVIMITAHANVQHAVRTMSIGAVDYIPKPFSTEELVTRVKRCLANPLPEALPTPVAPSPQASVGTPGYVGEHPSMQRLKNMLPLISKNNAPVFIQGESGTGKEILSRLIHEASDRATGPYVTINCANLPRELVESHLFGHRKGAFTGAVEDMTGAFERAHGGTLLLDEITEIDLPVQAKLLRVLQEQEFSRVGDVAVQQVDVRIIATSNRQLAEAIREGVFREDLYHRLSVFPLIVPPLRERASDIPLLVAHFTEKYSTLYGLPEKTIEPDLMGKFQQQAWPGNVRQLENLVQRGVLLSAERATVQVEDVYNTFFPEEPVAKEPQPGGTGFQTIEEMERHMILQALEATNNNQQQAAERLGISARTIRNKLRRYRELGLID